MSTLAEIEEAVQRLSDAEQARLLETLAKRVERRKPKAPDADALARRLEELRMLSESLTTGKPGMPFQALMDEIRGTEER